MLAAAKGLTLFTFSATKVGKRINMSRQILAATIVEDNWGVATSLAELFGTTKAGIDLA